MAAVAVELRPGCAAVIGFLISRDLAAASTSVATGAREIDCAAGARRAAASDGGRTWRVDYAARGG